MVVTSLGGDNYVIAGRSGETAQVRHLASGDTIDVNDVLIEEKK